MSSAWAVSSMLSPRTLAAWRPRPRSRRGESTEPRDRPARCGGAGSARRADARLSRRSIHDARRSGRALRLAARARPLRGPAIRAGRVLEVALIGRGAPPPLVLVAVLAVDALPGLPEEWGAQ